LTAGSGLLKAHNFALSIGWLFYKFELNALEVPVVLVVFTTCNILKGIPLFIPKVFRACFC
jgi:hypothetical protein